MWTEQKTQFIEAAARAVWEYVWRRQEPLCAIAFCRHLRSAHGPEEGQCEECHRRHDEAVQSVRDAVARGDMASYGPSLRTLATRVQHAFQLWDRDAPSTPDYAEFAACEFLGMLEEKNGCDLAVIVKAASSAQPPASAFTPPKGTCAICGRTADGHRVGKIAGELFCFLDDDSPTFTYEDGRVELADFAAAVILEALGAGVSWFDEHERFDLPARKEDIGMCRCGARETAWGHQRALDRYRRDVGINDHNFEQRRPSFVIPPFEFNYIDEAR